MCLLHIVRYTECPHEEDDIKGECDYKRDNKLDSPRGCPYTNKNIPPIIRTATGLCRGCRQRLTGDDHLIVPTQYIPDPSASIQQLQYGQPVAVGYGQPGYLQPGYGQASGGQPTAASSVQPNYGQPVYCGQPAVMGHNQPVD